MGGRRSLERFPIDLWHLDRQWFLRRTGVLEDQTRHCLACSSSTHAYDGRRRRQIGRGFPRQLQTLHEYCRQIAGEVASALGVGVCFSSGKGVSRHSGSTSDAWCLMVGWIEWMDGRTDTAPGRRTHTGSWSFMAGKGAMEGTGWIWLSLWVFMA